MPTPGANTNGYLDHEFATYQGVVEISNIPSSIGDIGGLGSKLMRLMCGVSTNIWNQLDQFSTERTIDILSKE